MWTLQPGFRNSSSNRRPPPSIQAKPTGVGTVANLQTFEFCSRLFTQIEDLVASAAGLGDTCSSRPHLLVPTTNSGPKRPTDSKPATCLAFHNLRAPGNPVGFRAFKIPNQTLTFKAPVAESHPPASDYEFHNPSCRISLSSFITPAAESQLQSFSCRVRLSSFRIQVSESQFQNTSFRTRVSEPFSE